MAVRASMNNLIAKLRQMLADPSGANQHFDDETLQDKLDELRDDVRYLQLALAPSLVNASSTNNVPQLIFADFYSPGFQWWETDVVLQGYVNGAAWVVLTPLASDYIVGRWQFELTPFVNGTFPGQYPPVFATGKTYDLNAAAADLLDFWAADLTCAYDISVEGQRLSRSQLMEMKMKMADRYRCKAKPRMAKQVRHDIMPDLTTMSVPVLGFGGDAIKGGW